jgi:hypothetical protein
MKRNKQILIALAVVLVWSVAYKTTTMKVDAVHNTDGSSTVVAIDGKQITPRPLAESDLDWSIITYKGE